ncbi:MAG: sugar transferase [Lachnospiraceae bacterium]
MYRTNKQSWVKHLDFMVLDLICLQISFALAYMIRHGFHNPYAEGLYVQFAVIMALFEMLVSVFFESFKNVLKRGIYQEFTMTVKHICLVELLSSFYLFYIQKSQSYSRIVFYLSAFFYVIFAFVSRNCWKNGLKKRRNQGGKRALLIVTTGNLAGRTVRDMQENNYEMFHLAGIAVIDCDMTGQTIEGINVVANQDTVTDFVCRQWVDEVFINLPNALPYPSSLIEHLMEMGVIVHMKLAQSSGSFEKHQLVEQMGNFTVLTTGIHMASTGQLFLKRVMDIAGGLIGCIITAMLTLIIGPVIYMHSPGTIFFSQIRVGKNGKKFKMYKFRSMYMDAEERKQELIEQNRIKDGMMFKLDWDPRIIGNKKLPDGRMKKGIGNFIRYWSLDEFPQFFNVLKGDMSLVGTRPPTVDEWEKYELHHRARLAAKPGITGMWQISGRSNITDFEEVVKLDLKYISEWSIELDLKILAKTFAAVMAGNGAM